jgi:N-acetylglucosaminyl-diphospho-decaprenol L-rhamnosyltransferase
MRDRAGDEICAVDWVYGAAMLVRRVTYRQAGLLDECSFFMYSEEVDWCKRIKSTPRATGTGNWQIYYVPQAQVVHYEGRSSEQASAKRMIWFNTSKVHYFRKHHGAFKALVLRAALLAMFVYQTGIESAKWLLGHRRDLRAQRVKAYASVLRSGLK